MLFLVLVSEDLVAVLANQRSSLASFNVGFSIVEDLIIIFQTLFFVFFLVFFGCIAAFRRLILSRLQTLPDLLLLLLPPQIGQHQPAPQRTQNRFLNAGFGMRPNHFFVGHGLALFLAFFTIAAVDFHGVQQAH